MLALLFFTFFVRLPNPVPLTLSSLCHHPSAESVNEFFHRNEFFHFIEKFLGGFFWGGRSARAMITWTPPNLVVSSTSAPAAAIPRYSAYSYTEIGSHILYRTQVKSHSEATALRQRRGKGTSRQRVVFQPVSTLPPPTQGVAINLRFVYDRNRNGAEPTQQLDVARDDLIGFECAPLSLALSSITLNGRS